MRTSLASKVHKLRYFPPKLFPFLALDAVCFLTGAPLDLIIDLRSHFPANIYDVRTIDGLRFGTRLFRDATIRDEMDEIAFLNVKPREGDTVLDVGANIGAYTLRYSKLVGPKGQVVAFEPVPDNRRILLWNLKLNNIQNTTVRPEALAESDGTALINLSRGPSAESLVKEFHKSGELPVRTVTLDSLRMEKLDLAKVDVEGAELNVLRGARETLNRLRPRMQIEVHSPHGEGCQVCNWTKDLGYSVRIIHQKKVGAQIHWVDAYY